MPRADLDTHFGRIDDLVKEIDGLVPSSDNRCIQFRADLAGMLVVAMAATYESCVKEIFFDFANNHHIAFGDFAQRNYRKLNSRIQVKDLKTYCNLFDPSIEARFKYRLSKKKKCILDRTGVNIELSYEQILSWRHEFAHTGARNTTIEEAYKTHRIGKRILYAFDDAFNRP